MSDHLPAVYVPYAFDIKGAANYTASSEWRIQEALRRKELTPTYDGAKVKIKRSELEHWTDTMPNERTK